MVRVRVAAAACSSASESRPQLARRVVRFLGQLLTLPLGRQAVLGACSSGGGAAALLVRTPRSLSTADQRIVLRLCRERRLRPILDKLLSNNQSFIKLDFDAEPVCCRDTGRGKPLPARVQNRGTAYDGEPAVAVSASGHASQSG